MRILTKVEFEEMPKDDSVCEILTYSSSEVIEDYEWLTISFPLHHKFFTRYVVKDNSWNVFGWTK